MSDPTTAHDDYRIAAITEALFDHNDVWVTMDDEQGVVFDLELAAVVAVAAIEQALEEDLDERICRHLCHKAEQEDNIKALRAYSAEFPETAPVVDQLVLMLMDEGK